MTEPLKFYAVEVDEKDEHGSGPPVVWCVSQWEDDPADAILWMNEDLPPAIQEMFAQLIAEALTELRIAPDMRSGEFVRWDICNSNTDVVGEASSISEVGGEILSGGRYAGPARRRIPSEAIIRLFTSSMTPEVLEKIYRMIGRSLALSGKLW